MRVDRLRIAPLLVLGLLLLAGPAAASDPEIESAIAHQDRLLDAGNQAQLLREAEQGVERNDGAPSRFLLGRAHGLRGELEEAREQFDWALEMDPGCAYAYLGLGIYHVLSGDPVEGEKQLKLALGVDPRLTRARVELGKLYFQLEDRVSAEREFRAVLADEPGNHEVRNLLAHQYLKEKRFDHAAQEFRIVLSGRPDDRPARKGLALALAFGGKTEEAIGAFEQVVAATPKDLEAYVFLKNLYLEKKDDDAAIRALERLLAVAPAESPIRKEAEQEIERIRKGLSPGGKVLTIPDLLAKLESKDVEDRREAMRILVEHPLVPPPKRVVRAVTDEDKVVRVLAVKYLGVAGGDRAIGLLEVLLLHPTDRDGAEEVRGAAVDALARTGQAGVVPILIAALADPSLYVFRLAVARLRELTGMLFAEDEEAPVEASQRAELLRSWRGYWTGPRSFSMKLDAIASLRTLAIRRLAHYLLDLLVDPERRIAREARSAFQALTGFLPGRDADLDTPEGRRRIRTAAAAALGRRGR